MGCQIHHGCALSMRGLWHVSQQLIHIQRGWGQEGQEGLLLAEDICKQNKCTVKEMNGREPHTGDHLPPPSTILDTSVKYCGHHPPPPSKVLDTGKGCIKKIYDSTRWPGCVADSRVFRESSLHELMEHSMSTLFTKYLLT